MNQKSCSNCGNENSLEARYCMRCGHELPATVSTLQREEQTQLVKKKKPTWPTMLIVAAGVIVAAGLFFLAEYGIGQFNGVDSDLKFLADELNATCPLMIDKETRLDNALALPGKTFQYNYTLVNLTRQELDIPEFRSIMTPRLENAAATHPDLSVFREKGVTLDYNYLDRDGVHVLKISVRAQPEIP